VQKSLGCFGIGSARFVTRSFTGFEVNAVCLCSFVRRYPGSADVADACGV